MNNYKIKVNSEAESKEAQELFFELGYVKENWLWSGYNEYPIELRTRDDGYSDFVLNAGNAIERQEITLQKLREMANQDQDEPFLTPECTLNDQYAEIEQVRQAVKVKSGSDSDHAADAMSYGFMGGIEATLAERQSTYGSFEDVAFVTENIMSVLGSVRVNGLSELPATHRMALYMIASKMARIVNGDFNHLDGWHDIGGYAKLVEDLIKENNKTC